MICPLGRPAIACQDTPMRLSLTLILLTFGHMAAACEAPVCLVAPDARTPTRIVPFEDTQSSHGPDHLVKDLLVLGEATFGQPFPAQILTPEGANDQFVSSAWSPLTPVAGDTGKNRYVVFLHDGNAGSTPKIFYHRSAYGIMRMYLPPVGENATGFLHPADATDIADVVITNTNLKRQALDNIRFGKNPELS